MEGSKTFAKDFMARWNIPTAEYRNFNNYEAARSYLDTVAHKVVLKANGLYVHFESLLPLLHDWLTHESCLKSKGNP